MNRFDLYLGSDIGLWALQQIPVNYISRVFTVEDEIARTAESRKLKVEILNANLVEFEPAKIGFSVHYPRILKPHLISRYEKIYNIHPAYLPWGRGYYPIFWALWEETPAGVTVHEINSGIDEGPIVTQVKVDYYPYDTGSSLFKRVREAEKNLFLIFLQQLFEGKEIISYPQHEGGNYHSKKDFFDLKQKSDWQSMTGKDLIKLIRCLTFLDFSGLEIDLNKKRFEIHLEPLDEV